MGRQACIVLVLEKQGGQFIWQKWENNVDDHEEVQAYGTFSSVCKGDRLTSWLACILGGDSAAWLTHLLNGSNLTLGMIFCQDKGLYTNQRLHVKGHIGYKGCF